VYFACQEENAKYRQDFFKASISSGALSRNRFILLLFSFTRSFSSARAVSPFGIFASAKPPLIYHEEQRGGVRELARRI
jgi:hypothetical protein